MMQTLTKLPCKICGDTALKVGVKNGKWRTVEYNLYRCQTCCFAFVGNPSTDYEQIYTLDYYKGLGADPLVDYFYELQNPERTIRQYEWRGIASILSGLKPISTETTWLDFGCGNGGLVRWLRQNLGCKAVGFEEGAIANNARDLGIPILSNPELEAQSNCYDVITAIEVLEHIPDPLPTLQTMFKLLKTGGVIFYTTGNATRFRKRLASWSYVVPEIHISFYEPATLEYALTKIGFRTKKIKYQKGFEDIIRFKILKSFRVRNVNQWETKLPWQMLSFAADRVYGVSAFPIAYKD